MLFRSYRLSYSWYEEYSPRLFCGPKIDCWENYCDSLLPEAIDLAIKNNSTETRDRPMWVGWSEITDAMAEILAQRGYEELNPPEKVYWGSNIIRNNSDINRFVKESSNIDKTLEKLSKVMDHNKLVEKDLYGADTSEFEDE